MSTLDELAIKYSADKSSQHHNYCKYYEKHLESKRNDSFILWEIGVWKGSSMRMWREYFPNATIIGFDIKFKSRNLGDFFTKHENNTKFVLGDATKIELINDTVKKFGTPDVVIDDGSHYMKDMIASYENIFPLINKNGLYCVEDLSVCGHPPFCQKTDTSMLNYIGTKIVDELNLNKYGVAMTGDKVKRVEAIQKNNTIWGQPNNIPLNVFEKTVCEIHMYSGLSIIVKNEL